MTPAAKKAYLARLDEGMSRTRAANECGMTNVGIERAMQNDQRFADDVAQVMALRDDDVEDALWKRAVAGNVEAQKFWLTNRDGGRWANRSTVSHVNSESNLIQIATQAVAALRTVLADPETRLATLDFIDVEVISDSEDHRELGAG